jgi:hypothetical protein
VAQDRSNGGNVVHDRVDVGSADGAEFYIDDDLSGSRGRVGQFLDSELLVTLVDGGSHKSHSSSLGCLQFRQMIADAIVTSGSE